MDRTKTMDQMEEIYKEELRDYKMQIDEIMNRQSELSYELQSYQQKVEMLREEDKRIFEEFLGDIGRFDLLENREKNHRQVDGKLDTSPGVFHVIVLSYRLII